MRAACATSDDAAGDAAVVPPLAPFWYLLVAQYELPSLRALSRAFGAELERGGCAVTHLHQRRGPCARTSDSRLGRWRRR